MCSGFVGMHLKKNGSLPHQDLHAKIATACYIKAAMLFLGNLLFLAPTYKVCKWKLFLKCILSVFLNSLHSCKRGRFALLVLSCCWCYLAAGDILLLLLTTLRVIRHFGQLHNYMVRKHCTMWSVQTHSTVRKAPHHHINILSCLITVQYTACERLFGSGNPKSHSHTQYTQYFCFVYSYMISV